MKAIVIISKFKNEIERQTAIVKKNYPKIHVIGAITIEEALIQAINFQESGNQIIMLITGYLLENETGFDAARTFIKQFPKVLIVIFTSFENIILILECKEKAYTLGIKDEINLEELIHPLLVKNYKLGYIRGLWYYFTHDFQQYFQQSNIKEHK